MDQDCYNETEKTNNRTFALKNGGFNLEVHKSVLNIRFRTDIESITAKILV